MTSAARALILVASFAAGSANAQALPGSTRVEFPVAGGSGEEILFGHLFLPGRAAAPPTKNPAIVIVHGSGGVRDLREGFWGRELAAYGMAVLAIDSFTPRGVKSTAEDQAQVSGQQMILDAFGALSFLSKHEAIDPSRIAVMGMSKGGSVALQAADERDTRRAGAAFAAHIPLYPGCSTQYRHPRMKGPILMLIGADDDYTGVKPCAEYAERIRAADGRVELKIYEGAHHGFDGDIGTLRNIWIAQAQNYRDCVVMLEDSGGATLANTGAAVDLSDTRKAIEMLSRVCMRKGATVGFKPAARKQAVEDVKAFLKTNLIR